jgi:hypothetical protein
MIHQGPVRFVTFSPDGRYLATGSEDKTARVFEAVSGKEVAQMVLGGPVRAIRYAAEGRYLISASIGASEKELVLTKHLLRPQDLIDDACARLTQNLPQNKWQEYVGAEVPYHKTCPNLPVPPSSAN